MSRYIKENDVIEGIRNNLVAGDNIYWQGGYVEDEVAKFPAADVVEVKHGEWIKTTIAERCGTDELHRIVYRDRETVKCSECGNPSPIYNIKFEFCPRCGAKMQLDEEDIL